MLGQLPVDVPELQGSTASRVLLLPGRRIALIIEVTDASVRVVVATGDLGGGDPTLPPGFTPVSARVAKDGFYLLGSQCDLRDACKAALLRSAESPVKWERISLGELVDDEPSLTDPGVVGDRFYVAPGNIGGPALMIREADGRWSTVAWPSGLGGSPLFSCSTLGTVFLFGAVGSPLSGSSDPSQQAADVPFGVFALQADRTWVQVVDDRSWFAGTDGRAADDTTPIVCGSGRLMVPALGRGSLVVEKAKDGSFVVDRRDVAPFPTPPSDQLYPRAGLVEATGQLVTADGRPDRRVPSGGQLLATAESPEGLFAVVKDSDSTVHLYGWPT